MSHDLRLVSSAPPPQLDLATLLYPARESATLEEQVMWRCSRVALTPQDLSEVANLGARLDTAGWERMVARARMEGVANLVFTHAVEAGLLPRIHGEIVEQLRQDYGAVAVTTRRLEIALSRLLSRLQEVGAPVIIVKGLTLARRLYDDIALRPISDIDLIVRLEDAPRWSEALRAAGFMAVAGKSQPLSKHVLRFREMQFSDARGRTIEMHVSVCRYPAYQRAFPAGEIWARAQALEGRENTYGLRLAPTDELCFLCMHYAVQHQIGRLIWLTDVAEIARRMPDSQPWDTVVDDVIARGVAAPVAVTLARAQILLDAPVPADALERLRVAALTPAARQAWASATRPMSGARWYLSQLAVVGAPMERAALLWNGAVALARRVRHGQRPYSTIVDGG